MVFIMAVGVTTGIRGVWEDCPELAVGDSKSNNTVAVATGVSISCEKRVANTLTVAWSYP
jgi:hypothetical protein